MGLNYTTNTQASSQLGNRFTDPKLMSVIGNNVGSNQYAFSFEGTSRGTEDADFWTELDKSGVSSTDAWTATVEKTVLSVTGRGDVFFIVAPRAPAAGTNLTIKVTVDGLTDTLTLNSLVDDDRIVLMSGFPSNSVGAAGQFDHQRDSGSGDFITAISTGASGIPPVEILLQQGVLHFSESFEVKMTSSAAISVSGQEANAGAYMYYVDDNWS